jgi:hypothetical protein
MGVVGDYRKERKAARLDALGSFDFFIKIISLWEL